MPDLIQPQNRTNLIGHAEAEAQLRGALEAGKLSHGWILAGPKGIGKATLAWRIARAVLEPSSLENNETLAVSPDAQALRLIAQGAHPDLFLAERPYDEKKDRRAGEIPVDTARALIRFMARTPALGGYRVAIVDAADELNRNAANALLKVLEEPPAKSLLILIAHAPGRLIATIRSRCRRIDLRAPGEAATAAFLRAEGVPDADAARLAAHSGGRPGAALALAVEGGADALDLADAFFAQAAGPGDFTKLAPKLAARGADETWRSFRAVVLARLCDLVRTRARGEGGGPAGYDHAPVERLLAAWEKLAYLAERGEALNADRGQLLFAMGFALRDAARG